MAKQCYWSKQAEDKHANWVNAPLTEQGMKQAEEAKEFWAKEIKEQMLPMPQTYYTSPLKRSLQTAKITFSELVDPFVPVVKERLREVFGVHTCDRRSSRTEIKQNIHCLPLNPTLRRKMSFGSPMCERPKGNKTPACRNCLTMCFPTMRAPISRSPVTR